MNFSQVLKTPLYALELAGPAKSFKNNPLIGNKRLNEWGLHRKRLTLAAHLATQRRAALGKNLSEQERLEFEENGYLLKENYLSYETFKALKDELLASPLPAREMKQGQTVTRMTPLSRSVLMPRPTVRQTITDPSLLNQIRYVASYGGQPVFFIQTVLANPSQRAMDPQTAVHADTFHSTAKAWLFLEDVGPEDGPFSFAPGSHKLTQQRIEWEYRNSIRACQDKRNHHAHGSFRANAKQLDRMGYNQPRPFPVRANTLVIADTFGFHGRTPSQKPTVRVELHAHMRRNPFMLWNAPDVKSLPFIKHRELDLFLAYNDFLEKQFGRRTIWRDVGSLHPTAPSPLFKAT